MVCCAVSGCKNNNIKYFKKIKSEPTAKVRYFRFPKNNIRSQWIKRSCREDCFNADNSYICSLHFTEEDFNSVKNRLLNVPFERRQLNPDAVPSINLPQVFVVKKKEDEERIRKEKHDEIIATLLNDTNSNDSNDSDVIYVSSGAGPSLKREMELKTIIEMLKQDKLKLKQDNLILCKQVTKYEMQESRLQEIFTEGQLKKLKSNKNKVNWTAHDISSALELYEAGPKAYFYLYKKQFPLPSPSTLKKWSRDLKNVKTENIQEFEFVEV